MEFIKDVMEIVVHFDKHLGVVIQSCGGWSYMLLFLIIFAETGLVITPFLPGDSLLFAVGAFAALGSFNVFWLFGILTVAAIIGDSVNYAIGNMFGEKILLNSNFRFIKREHLDQTHKFYEKYGGKTIILARFIPIIRTFAPFVAGIGKMNYRYFFLYNVAGALLWVSIFVIGGYCFGNMPLIKENFAFVILAIIVLSVLPAVIEYWKHRNKNKTQLIQARPSEVETIPELDAEMAEIKEKR
ncbi:MAG: DedA family protein [Verrucomicrobiota bacterium]